MTKDDYIPLAEFSPDHWSTLAYADTVMVDCGGFQVGFDPRMRQNRRDFRVMAEQCPSPKRTGKVYLNQGMVMDLKYSTVTKSGEVIQGHDDWCCIQDMVEAGMMGVKRRGKIVPDVSKVQPKAILHLTPLGRQVVEQLRAHKSGGGTWATFTPNIETTAQAVAA